MAKDGPGYLLDNRQAQAGIRFTAIAELFDDWTFRHLDRIGVRPGWRCWEVGAGGPLVARWLAQRAGPTGDVLATDIDLSWLADLAPDDAVAPIDVRRHDVGADPVPGTGFDLVHARLVLVHLPDRERALRAMASAVRLGGWLVIEDADPALQPLACPDESGAEQVLANRIRHGFRSLLAARGADLSYGRTLPRLLRAAGLERVGAEVYFPLSSPASVALEIATVEQIRSGLIEAGLASAAEIETHLATLAAGGLDIATAPLVTAWGQVAG